MDNNKKNLFPSLSETPEDGSEKKDRDGVGKKRDEYLVDIRRQKREEILNTKRMFHPDDKTGMKSHGMLDALTAGGSQNEDLKKYIDSCLMRNFAMEDFFGILEAINTNDRFKQHFGVIGLRKILSIEEGPPIQPVIDANLVPKLIEFMQRDDEPHLQLEAAWALTNIASGSTQQTQTIIDKGGIPLFIRLLKSPHIDVAEQAIWALGNISGDSATYRDMVLKCGGLEPLMKLVTETKNKSTVKHGTWAISNLCRGRPLPAFNLVFKAIDPLCKVIKEETDPEILTDATWAISYLSDGDDTRIQLVVETGVVPALIKLLDHPFLSILIPALRTLGNIVTGTEEQTQTVLSQNPIPKLFFLLKHEKRPVRRECCWALSNITAGTAEQIQPVVSNKELIQKLITIAQTDCAEIRREATWVLSNATNNGTPEQMEGLIQFGVLDCFIALLDSDDAKTVAVILEAITNILNCGVKVEEKFGENVFLTYLDAKGGTKKIEKLQEHSNDEVYIKALKLLEEFFEIDDAF
jgi:hypothetical protein